MVDWSDSELSITKQAELLSLNRSSLYYKPVQPSSEDVAMKHRIYSPDETPFLEEDLLELRHLERLRFSFVDQCSDLKRKIISLLDHVFPEYEKVFSNIFGLSSTEVLLNAPLPEDLLDIDTQKLANLLNQVSKGRYGESRARAKAHQLQDSALDSFGITVGLDRFKLQIKLF